MLYTLFYLLYMLYIAFYFIIIYLFILHSVLVFPTILLILSGRSQANEPRSAPLPVPGPR